jgi:hypothetical protein
MKTPAANIREVVARWGLARHPTAPSHDKPRTLAACPYFRIRAGRVLLGQRDDGVDGVEASGLREPRITEMPKLAMTRVERPVDHNL